MKRVVTKAPPGWEALYNVVKTVRSHVKAPVDTIGCSRLFDPKAPKEDQRYQTLLALMLSAQTKDQKTAEAMVNLKTYGCTAKQIARCDEKKLDSMIGMVGFHNKKASYIKRTTDIINKEYGGVVPTDYKQLTAMPGLGPKMVHLFLQCADGEVQGIGVDIHVHRIAHRFKWVSDKSTIPDHTRKELEAWLPREHWDEINEILVGFGQTICTPRFPDCLNCPARSLCPGAFKEESTRQKTERMKLGHATVKDAKGSVAEIISASQQETAAGETPSKKKAAAEGKKAAAGSSPVPKKKATAKAASFANKNKSTNQSQISLDDLCKELAMKRKERSQSGAVDDVEDMLPMKRKKK